MTISIKILLSCILILNITIVVMNLPAWQNIWGPGKKMSMAALTLLNTTNSQNLRGASDDGFLSQEPASIPPVHPFDQLHMKLEQLDWDPERIDEVIRKYWNTHRTFLEFIVSRSKNTNTTILSTSCLHTAAWIVTGLLELQIRPNSYMGLWKRPKDQNLILYDNTQDDAEMNPAPAVESIRKFIASRPADEPILLQVDMYQPQDEPSYYYIDHHFALHVYDGQVNLYHSWQDVHNLIEWMKEPHMFKQRYPMPVDNFLALLEKSMRYTEDENEMRERYEAIWKLFGITDTFVYGKKSALDPVVRRLRYPWVLSYITHWPSQQSTELTQI